MDNTMQLNKSGRNSLIDILKGICILFVIFTHYNWTMDTRLGMFFPFWIDMAVPVFMVISGYVNAKSFESKGIDSIEEAYQKTLLITKLLRFLVPFVIAYGLECMIQILCHRFTVASFVKDFFHGGYGPGTYYFPVMVQFVFIYPVIYFIIKKHGLKGLILCFAINLAYEFLQRISYVPKELYVLLSFRYISVIAFGTYFALNPDDNIKWFIKVLIGLIGVLFIILVEYTSYTPKIFVYWTRTSCMATLYIFPICSFLLKSRQKEFKCRLIELFGKASFNIFLVQMVYYWHFSGKVYNHTSNVVIRIILNFVICLVGGISFYLVENKLTGMLIKRIRSNENSLSNSR